MRKSQVKFERYIGCHNKPRMYLGDLLDLSFVKLLFILTMENCPRTCTDDGWATLDSSNFIRLCQASWENSQKKDGLYVSRFSWKIWKKKLEENFHPNLPLWMGAKREQHRELANYRRSFLGSSLTDLDTQKHIQEWTEFAPNVSTSHVLRWEIILLITFSLAFA